MIQGFFLVLLKYLEDEKDNIILSNNVCKGVSENLAEVQPLAFSCSFLTVSILIYTFMYGIQTKTCSLSYYSLCFGLRFVLMWEF